MENWKTLRKELLTNKEFAKEYKALAPRYALISKLIEARIKKGLTQKELAQKLGTKQSAIARIESGKANPSLRYVEKMTAAMNLKFTIQLS